MVKSTQSQFFLKRIVDIWPLGVFWLATDLSKFFLLLCGGLSLGYN